MRQIKLVLLMIVGCFFISACSTTNVKKVDADDGLSTAKRFVKNIGVANGAMDTFKKMILQETKNTPNLKEHFVRVSEMASESDFAGYIAKVYSRNVDAKDLTALADMSESPVIKRYFQEIRSNRASAKPVAQMALLNRFNKDEVGEILKFVSSDSFIRLNSKLPVINAELKKEGREYGRRLFQKYAASQ